MFPQKISEAEPKNIGAFLKVKTITYYNEVVG